MFQEPFDYQMVGFRATINATPDSCTRSATSTAFQKPSTAKCSSYISQTPQTSKVNLKFGRKDWILKLQCPAYVSLAWNTVNFLKTYLSRHTFYSNSVSTNPEKAILILNNKVQHIHIYIYIHTYIYTYIYIHIYTYIYTYIYNS
jgi:hypothetical protein